MLHLGWDTCLQKEYVLLSVGSDNNPITAKSVLSGDKGT